MRIQATRIALIGCTAILLAACGYIVTPAGTRGQRRRPRGRCRNGRRWPAGHADAAGDLHVDLTIKNETGDWSAMQVAPSGAVVLTTSDGKSTPCGTIFVGTGGTSLAPGFQVRGYTGGTKAKPVTQLLSVECPGAAPAAGSRLAIDYTFVAGEFNYYSPTRPVSAKLVVDLDSPSRGPHLSRDRIRPPGLVSRRRPIRSKAINKGALMLTAVDRTADTVEFTWDTQNPPSIPSTSISGSHRSSARTVSSTVATRVRTSPIPPSPAKGSAPVEDGASRSPPMSPGCIVPSVESKQQKLFVSHAIDITDK